MMFPAAGLAYIASELIRSEKYLSASLRAAVGLNDVLSSSHRSFLRFL